MLVNRKLRRGFTMLELVVVLAILAVLAGLIISIMPSLMTRTHLAKCAATIAELNKVWMRSFAMNIRYPDYYDSLLDQQLNEPMYLPRGLRDQGRVDALQEGEVTALAAIGIRHLVDGSAGATNTYDYAPFGALARTLTATAQVFTLDLSAHETAGNLLGLKRHLVRQADGTFADQRANTRYVVFGIGSNCTAVGTGRQIQEAPVHFAASDEINPSTAYQRYLVVFSIVNNGNNRYTAYYECAAGNDVTGPSSSEAHTQGFHDVSAKDG